MGLEVRFARDGQGKPTAASPPPIEAVGAYFEREVGPDPGQGDWVLEAIDDVLTGRETGALDVGTKHTHSYVIVDTSYGGFVEVCCDLGGLSGPYRDVRTYSHQTWLECQVAIPDFRAALVDWLAFVRGEASAAGPGASADPRRPSGSGGG